MKNRLKGLLALMLSLTMMLSMVTVGWGSMTPQGVHACDTANCLVCDVAAKINALPVATDITVNNAAAVTEQIHAIDRVKVDLTDDQYDELLTVVATRPNSSGYGLAEPVRYMEAVEKVTSLNAGGSLYITKSYSVGSAQLDWAQTDATISIECLDAGSAFAPLSVTLADIAESSLAGFYSTTSDGWTNCYTLPAGTYKITETGYNAVTTSGAALTTTPTYEVDGTTTTDYAVVTVENGGSSVVYMNNSTSSVYVGGAELGEGRTPTYYKNGDTNDSLTGSESDYNAKLWTDSGVLTLTLKGLTLENYSGTCIEARKDLTIVLEGKNTITSTSDYGISVTGNLTIKGDGSLTVSGTGYGINAPKGDITITGGTVNATGNDCGIDVNTLTISGDNTKVTATGGMKGIHANFDGDSTFGSITISGGTVTATGNVGINTNILTIEGGTVNATGSGTNSYGILGSESNGSLGDVAIKGGTVTATGSMGGIGADNEVTIEGGTVIAKGTATTDSVGIYAVGMYGGTLTIGGANTKVTVGCETGLKSNTVNILDGSTVTIDATEDAIANSATLNLGTDNRWYEWTDSKTATLMNDSDFALSSYNGNPPAYLRFAPIGTGVDNSNGGGTTNPYPPSIYYPTPTPEPTKVTSPNTFDSGIALSVAMTILSATGSAVLAKKKD